LLLESVEGFGLQWGGVGDFGDLNGGLPFDEPFAAFAAGDERSGAVDVSRGGSSEATRRVLRPKWTSISVFNIRSRADFIISRIGPLRSSAVLA
jgi:hypothetical protein